MFTGEWLDQIPKACFQAFFCYSLFNALCFLLNLATSLQERVYEDTVGNSSPEIASLIPTILTPCSSNCETVTPEVERSPSVTPIHKTERMETVS